MKIVFELDCTDGYPPVQYEMVNAERISDIQFRIKNVPFFVSDISYDDIVVATEIDAEHANFIYVEEKSLYTAVAIIIFDDSIGDEVKSIFDGNNCIMEYGEFESIHIFSVAIPSDARYFDLKLQLDKYEQSNQISYAELALVDRHKSIA